MAGRLVTGQPAGPSPAGAAPVILWWLRPLVRHTIGMASSPAQACVFCGIIAGELTASRVYEDDDVVAFMDMRPLTPGHVLVVPRAHAASLEDLDEDLGTRVFAVAHQLARALRSSAVPCEGVNFFLADGVAAGQEVFHVHLHVIPRTPGDGFRLKARARTPGRDELDATAERVREGMSSPPR
jgi:diadenosine tetraphosphate (Ap4A) HIT family hydrolase